TIDPVVNHVGADSEAFSHLLNRQLFWPYESGLGYLIAVTDPLDHRTRERFAQGANLPFLIEAIGDLPVGQALGEMPNAIHNRGGRSHTISYVGREMHANVSTGAALPPDVSQKLLRTERLLDRNILNEQPQHSLAVFGLCGGSMPYPRQIPC